MNGADRPKPIWFAGDRGDPGARGIASALPRGQTRWVDAPEDLPRRWPSTGAEAPRVVVIHRGILGATDGERVARLRGRLGDSRSIVLCVGPHVRYAAVDRWLRWVDVVLTETLAAETIARHVRGATPGPGVSTPPTGRTVAVVSTNVELRATLAAILQAAGHEAVERVDLDELAGSPGVATVWDVPVLEPRWADRLQARSATGPVVALIGFLDRATASLARAAGAAACLDLPSEIADLVAAVDRALGIRRDPAHHSPPAPMGDAKRVGKRRV